MQFQRNLCTALITLLVATATPFAPNFLALFPTLSTLAQTPNDSKAKADRLLQKSTQQYELSQFQAALLSAQQALTLYRQIGDKVGEWATLFGIGAVYHKLEQYADALRNYQQALVITKQVGNKAAKGDTLFGIGAVYLMLAQYPNALKNYQQALVIYQQVGNKSREGTILTAIGLVYHKLEQYAAALKNYQQALVIYQQVGDKAAEGGTLIGIGLVYHKLGQYAAALKNYQQALVIYQQVGDKAEEMLILNNIGAVYADLGQYAAALKNYQQVLVIHQQVRNKVGEMTVLNNIGELCTGLGQYAAALKSYQQALDIAKQVGDQAREGTTLNNIGELYFKLVQYPNALKNYQQALDIAKQVGNKAGEESALNNIGLVYISLGQYAAALKSYQQALDIAKQVGDQAGIGTILNNIGRVYYSLGQYADAERTLISSIQVQESLRPGLTDSDKISIFETQAGTYSLLQQVLIAQNKINTALEIAERSRARAFVELLAAQLSSESNAGVTITSPTFGQIQQIAKQQNATLIEYSFISEFHKVQKKWLPVLYIWVVKPTGKIAFRSVDLKNIDTSSLEQYRVAVATGRDRGTKAQNAILSNLVRSTRNSINQGDKDTATNSATADSATSATRSNSRYLQQMHQLLIQPITDLLPTDPKARVIFIPRGVLFLVPFPALQDSNGKYLIEKHTILSAPAIQVLELTRQQRQRVSSKNILVVGNPTMPSVSTAIGEPPQQLAPLPGAEQEAVRVASLLNTKAITGARATEAALKQQIPKARIIHLATHGFLDDFTGGGVPGAIALAPSAKDDGLLTADEILALKLTAELVVLSACDTGRGRITGDGVIGLSRSLLSAGVPSVVVSLWKVTDEPTASLMTEFYRQLQQNSDKADALRQAMLTTMKKHPNVRDWAAFTLIGEAE